MPVLRRLSGALDRDAPACAVILGFAVLYIVAGAYQGIVDPFIWRQADAYSQILGFLGERGLSPLQKFDGQTVMYDVPIYQALIAGAAWLTHIEPLAVVCVVNAALWVGLGWATYRLTEIMFGAGGLIAAGLAAVSPLFLHYYSVPLPDAMALTLAMVGACLLLDGRTAAPAVLFALAALIKSPVPFVILVTVAVWLVVTRSVRQRLGACGIVYGSAAVAAMAAEVARRIITPPTPESAAAFSPEWYFGPLALRLDPGLWLEAFRRLGTAFPFPLLTAAAVLVLLVAVALRRKVVWRPLVTLLAGYLAGWLVFANLYLAHHYYSLPTVALVYPAVGGAFVSLLSTATRWGRAVVVALVAVAMIYGAKFAERGVTSFPVAARYALEGVSQFALVSDDDTGPSWGGSTGTRMVRFTTTEFERSCEQILRQYRAVLVHGDHLACLPEHRRDVSSLLEGPEDTWVCCTIR